MGNLALQEFEQIRAGNRVILLVLTVLSTFLSCIYARGDWPLFWVMLGLWVFTGIFLAASPLGQRHLRR